MKICIVCSHGGHLTEALQILEAFNGHECFIVTYHSARDRELSAMARTYFTENIGTSPWRLIKTAAWALKLLRRERPDVIVSFGAEIALPFFYWAKLLNIRTIFIESWCRVDGLSKTGRLVYPVVDQFWVQWPQLLAACGSKAQYHGAVI